MNRKIKHFIFKNRIGQYICANLIGHDFKNCDKGGFVGGRHRDLWCNRCDKMVEIPFDEDAPSPEQNEKVK